MDWDSVLYGAIAQAREVGNAYVDAWGAMGIDFFDHRADWARGPGYWYWAERGVVGARYIGGDDLVLDLCCGDGFYTKHFFADRARLVHGLDLNAALIERAAQCHGDDRTEFYCRDAVADPFPAEHYDAVMCFAAIEHFTAEQLPVVLAKVAAALDGSPNGVFVGSTPKLEEDDLVFGHETIFSEPAQLWAVLRPHFASVETWEARWQWSRGSDDERLRWEMYFVCRVEESA
jgi:SAM-dependent methyltransferase